ncbi:hypothetical protein HPB47_025196, partial [Ixodes persulcatus]
SLTKEEHIARLQSRRIEQNQRCKRRRRAKSTDDDRATEAKRNHEARRRQHSTPAEQLTGATVRFRREFVGNPFGVRCAVCNRLWFAGDVSTIGGNSDEKKRETGACALRQCIELADVYKEPAFRTCRDSLLKGAVPRFATMNGYKYPPVPEHLPRLNMVEERLVAPRLPFMSPRRLTWNNWQSDQGRGPPRGPGRSYPAGLRGKEIGLFFARKNSAQNKWAQKNQRVALSIDPESQQELRHIIRGIRSEEGEGHERIDAINSVALDYLEGHGSGSSSAWGSPGHVTGVGLTRNPTLDERFRKDLEVKAGSPDFKKMLEFRKLLPAYKMKQQIVDLIESNQVVVISGETGSGKTTQIPQFILDTYINEGRGSTCRVICTQPRRISAITVAERVAAERGERCGDASAGYQIRLECRLPRDRGSILFCTTGILLQQLQSDPYIASASHVILDEVHERDLQTDFLAIVLKDLLTVRPDLRVVLMSATINADLFSRYFGNCPMLEIPGIAYPVEVHYLEDVLEFTRYRGNSGFEGRSQVRRRDQGRFQDAREEQMPFLRSLEGRYSDSTLNTLAEWNEERIDLDLVHELVRHICSTKGEGAILIFLPGWEQISDLNKFLTNDPHLRGSSLVIPLHSMMPTVNQRRVFDRPPQGIRKIVLATNIAETSITINDVVYVIDCGKIKMSNFDVGRNLATLDAEWVAVANAQQRKGRAGRVQPGVCYRLYTSWRESRLEAYQLPEMLRTRLESLVLKIKVRARLRLQLVLQN